MISPVLPDLSSLPNPALDLRRELEARREPMSKLLTVAVVLALLASPLVLLISAPTAGGVGGDNKAERAPVTYQIRENLKPENKVENQALVKVENQPTPALTREVRIDPALENALENASPNDNFDVLIFMREQPWISRGMRRASRSEKIQYLKSEARSRQPTLVDYLGRLPGVEVNHQYWIFNAVAAKVQAKHIRTIAKRPFVGFIYLQWEREPMLDVSHEVIKADTPQDSGDNGQGVKVGHLGGGIDDDNAWLVRDNDDNVVVQNFNCATNSVTGENESTISEPATGCT